MSLSRNFLAAAVLLASSTAIAQAPAPAAPAVAPTAPSATAPAAPPAATPPPGAGAPAKARSSARGAASTGSTSVTTVPGANAANSQKSAKSEKGTAGRGAGATTAARGTGATADGAAKDDGKRNATEAQRRQLQTLYAGVMTDDEDAAYRKKVRDVKTYDQCKALLEATHKAMEPRATTQGKPLAQSPTQACDQAKERGRLKG